MGGKRQKIISHSTTLVAVLLTLALVSALGPPVEALEPAALRRALLATVHIAVPITAEPDVYSTGSGSILTPAGLILTNFHVVGDTDTGQLNNSEGSAFVAVNPSDLRGLPTWTYRAVLVRGDPFLDLAIIKITAPFNGVGDLPDNLGLVTMAIGDSDSVEIGDAMSAIGFPGIGGDSVTLTKGTIAGFLDEDTDGEADWFKTDTEINHGNSGGAAINDAGELIGVPTAGVSDEEDAGKLGLIRPLNWAAPMIRAATAEITATSAITASGARSAVIVFTDTIDRHGQPGGGATRFKPGVHAIYASFTYKGFEDGLVFEASWTRNGEPVSVESWVWTGGESGADWVSLGGEPELAGGAYELILSLGGSQVGRGKMTIRPALLEAAPRITGLVFAEDASTQGEPIGAHAPDKPFGPGTAQVLAFFAYSNMADGTGWGYRWLLDGEEVASGEDRWSEGSSGNSWVRLSGDAGLPGGHYGLELRIGTALAAAGEFDVSGDTGIGQLPDAGVVVLGVILDADTEQPVPGATIIALNPGVGVQAFLRRPDEGSVYASGDADSDGRFKFSRPLERGDTYTLLVAADGYEMAIDGAYTVGATAGSSEELTIELHTSR